MANEDLIASLFDRIERADKVSDANISPIINTIVGTLASSTFPNKTINSLMSDTWNLIGNRIVPVVMFPDDSISSVSMLILMGGKRKRAAIVIPNDLPQRAEKDLLHYMGAFVFNGSKARDYWNDQIDPIEMDKRSKALEAELLITVKKDMATRGHEVNFNDYQKNIVETYPEGVKSVDSSLWYKCKPTPVEHVGVRN